MKANLIPIILKKNSKFKKFLMQTMKTTRNSLTINPLEEYSITSPTVINANTLIKQGAYGYIGGDTEYLSYDLGLKVAGSSVECPMKAYRMNASSLLIPSDINWVENTLQSNLDPLKLQDGSITGTNSVVNGNIAQMMIELDLTPVANALYGGSNSALKSALKGLNIDTWISGYGSNGGVSTNGCKVSIWNNNASVWSGSYSNINTLGTIAKTSVTLSSPDYAIGVTASNKIYFLINSQYASDGTIASSVSLDYINIGIQLNRTPDVVAPVNVNLPKYWAMVGGISPNFSNSSTLTKTLFRLYKDSNNYIDLICSSGVLTLRKNVSGSLIQLTSNAQTFSKNQGYRFIVGQTSNGMVLRILKSTGTMETYSNTNTQNMQNSYSFYMEQNEANSSQADCFMEKFTLLDLNKLGRTNGFSDSEADAILRGTTPNLIGSYNTELFDITKVSLHPNASLSNGVITLNATANFQSNYIVIPVLPNNRYILNFNKVGNGGYGYVSTYYNNILLVNGAYSTIGNLSDGLKTLDFITNGNVNRIIIYFTNYNSPTTITFSQISLKLKM